MVLHQVNTASRMESHGFPMCLHLSEYCVARLVREGANMAQFVLVGERQVKGKARGPD